MKEPDRPIARIAGVTQTYGHVIAVDQVSIDLPTGGIVGFIGPDGVGKSTLLSLIAGSRQIQSGSVYVLGGDIGTTQRIGPRSAPASPICRRAWARTFTRT